MALAFSKIEALKFGNLEVVPQMGAEQRLRVKTLEMKEENIEEIREVLSACFGEKAAEVKAFMEANLFLFDLMQIQIYLSQGQSGLDNLNKRMDKFMDKKIEQLVDKEEAAKDE